MRYLHNRLTTDNIAFHVRLRQFAEWQERESRRLRRRERAKRLFLSVAYWSLWAIVAFAVSYFVVKGVSR